MVKSNVSTRERQIELEDKIKECIKTLCVLEDITCYEIKEISNCINVLQELVIHNESVFEVEQ